MKKYLCFLPIVLWAACPLLLQANGLEIEMRIETTEPEPTDLTMVAKIQDGKIRSDMGEFSSIVNGQTGEVLSLLHAQRMFMRMPGGAVQEMMALVPTAGEEETGEGWHLEPTGKSEVISGLKAEEFTVPGKDMAVWLTKDKSLNLAPLLGLRDSSLFREAAAGWPQNLAEWPGFPVRIVSTDPAQPYTITVLRAQERPIDAAEFAPPANYQPMQLPTGFEEMMPQLPR